MLIFVINLVKCSNLYRNKYKIYVAVEEKAEDKLKALGVTIFPFCSLLSI